MSRSFSTAVRLGFAALLVLCAQTALAQAPDTTVVPVDLSVGRSYAIQTPAEITRIAVANPDIADVVVMSSKDIVVNGRGSGETDLIVWQSNQTSKHYRLEVHAPSDRRQIILAVKFAEIRRDLLRDYGTSALYRDPSGQVRGGSGIFNTDQPFTNPTTGAINPNGPIYLPSTADFATVLGSYGIKGFLSFLQAEEQTGDARILAEPHLMVANNDTATFLAGGEIPVPVAQSTATGIPIVTIEYHEFGIRLRFTGEIVSDSVIKLTLRPEVSTLDYANAVTLSGFKIPAFQTRRMESTVDVRKDQSLVISGMFDDERDLVRTGLPILMHIPILGALFSSTNWVRHKTELVVVVTPVVIDPTQPRSQDVIQFAPDTTTPGREVLAPRLPAPASSSGSSSGTSSSGTSSSPSKTP